MNTAQTMNIHFLLKRSKEVFRCHFLKKVRRNLFLSTLAALFIVSAGYAQVPSITSVSPASGAINATVTINGSNFSTTPANNIVYFGAVRASVTGATSTALTVVIPAGATYKPITVTVNGLTAYSAKPFIVTFTGVGSISASSFDRRIDYPTGDYVYNQLMGDIDGDGKSDLLLFSQNPNVFSVYLDSSVNGRPAFASKIDIATSSYLYGVAISDIDGDGKLDVVAVNYSNQNFSVFRNTSTVGSVSFDPQLNFSAGSSNYPYYLSIGDMDSDGKSDVVIVNNNPSSISIFRNISTIGTVNFSTNVDFTLGNYPNGLSIGDMDGDAKPDMVVATNATNQGIAVFRNTSSLGNFAFDTPVNLTTTTNFTKTFIGDFDGDGKMDVIGYRSSNAVSAFKNTSTIGTITFSSQVDFPIGSNIQDIALADIDGDGKPDIASANGTSSISIIRNTSTIGNISFSTGTDLSTNGYPRTIALGDIDGNGKPELISPNYLYGSSNFSIFRNIINEAPLPPRSVAAFAGNGKITLKWNQNSEPDILKYRIYQGTSSGGEILADSTSAGVSDTMRVITSVVNETRYYFRITAVDSTYKESGFSSEVNALLNVPVITSFSPASGTINTPVTINGLNFSTSLSDNVVYFGAVRAAVSSATTTSLTVSVPAGATFAPITVIVHGMTAYSGKPFNVTFAGGGSISTQSFDQQVDLPVGANPSYIVAGDIDGDGKPDIVVANQTENSISILRDTATDGREKFAPRIDFPTIGAPFGVALGDFDGDGKLDVAVVNQSGSSISVFRNTSTMGNISLAERREFSTSLYPYYLAIEDIDGDGKSDIVVTNYNYNSVSVLRNICTVDSINFSPKVDFTTGTFPYGVATGDLDGDGKPEIVTANYGSNSVSVLQNLSVAGNVKFAVKIDYATGNYPYGVVLADIDGDGKFDITSVNIYSSTISLLRNTSTVGSFSFSAKVDFALGNYAQRAVVGDIDGDAKPDIAVGTYNGNSVSVFRNISSSGSITSGSLAARVNITTGNNPYGIALCDMDGNGKPELITANSGSNTVSVLRNIISEPPLPPQHLLIYAGNAQITLKWNRNTEPDFLRYRIYRGTISGGESLIDSTASGIADTVRVYSSGISNNVTYYFRVTAIDSVWKESGWSNEVSGTPLNTLTATSFSPASGPAGTSVTITGTNFSTTPENNIVYFGSVRAAVTSASPTSLDVSVPAGATYAPITITVNYYTVSFNVPFLVTFPDYGPLKSSSFDKRVDSTTGNSPYALAIGDMDGDQKSDIITANRTANTISVLRNMSANGRENFAEKNDFPTGTYPQGIAIGDLNGDGKLDVVTANLSANTISVLQNLSATGNIQFALKFDSLAGISPSSVAIGDLDNDGLQDIVVSNSVSNTISVFRNTSTFTGGLKFAAGKNYPTGNVPQSISLSDIDKDGRMDIIIANQGANTVSVIRNLCTVGNINFAAGADFSVGYSPNAVAVGDIDGDGNIDVLTANQSDNTISVLLNTSFTASISFSTHVDFSTGSSPISLAVCDLNGDGKPDVVTSNSGSSTISLLQNTSTSGSISFNGKVDLATSLYSIVAGDMDGNAKPEIVGVSSSANAVSILRNIINEPPLSPQNLSVVKALNAHVNLAWTKNTEPDFLRYRIYQGTTSGGEVLRDSTSANISDTAKICTGLTNGTLYYFRITAIDSSGLESIYSNEVHAIPTVIPAIASFTPAMGPVGSTVTISGEGFNATASNNIVYFGATKAIVTGGSTTSLTTTVPVGATCAPISVTTNGLSAYSFLPFIETFLGGGVISSTTFAPKLDFPIGNYPQKIIASDIDGDGQPDAIMANYSGNTISILRDSSTTGGIAFGSKLDFVVGSNPYCVAACDFDGDGKLDLAVGNVGTYTLSIVRNTSTPGNVNFAPKIDYATGYYPYNLAVGDLDGDGKPDIVVVNYSNSSVSVYRNISTVGSMNFSPKIEFPTGTSPYDVAIGDIDGDGRLDIATANSNSSSISILRNISILGNISFSQKVDFSIDSSPTSVAIVDLDGDGKLDVAVTSNSYYSLSIFRNTSSAGNINFAVKINITYGNYSKNLTPADIDGDGRMDLVIGYESYNNISILRNHSTLGNIGFDSKIDFTAENLPYSAAVADIDGDGKPDILTGNYSAQSISVLRNVISAPPSSPKNLSALVGTGQVALKWNKNTDYDFLKYRIYAGATSGGESLVDSTSAVVTDTTRTISGLTNGATYYFRVTAMDSTRLESTYSNEVIVQLNIPIVTSFTPTSGTSGTSVTITGINFSPTSGNNIVFFGAVKAQVTSATSTSLTVTVPSGATCKPISVTVNGKIGSSSHPFIVTFAGGGAISRSGFSTKTDYTTGAQPVDVSISDIDGDGKPDVVASNWTGFTFSTFRNTSIGTTFSLAPKSDFSSDIYPWAITTQDLDGDGKPDVVVTNLSGSNVISVFRDTGSSGNIQYSAKQDFGVGVNPYDVTIGDLDRDGKPDIIVPNCNSNTFSVLRNISTIGNIAFEPKVDFATGSTSTPYGIACGDIDGDGKLDIIVVNFYGYSMSIYRNTSTVGSISFDAKVDYSIGSYPQRVSCGDLDNDGKLDLVALNAGGGGSLSIYRNASSVGTIAMVSRADVPVGTSPYDVALGDLDGDGKIDIVTANQNANTISILRNTSTSGNISTTSKLDIAVGTYPYAVALGDLNGDDMPEIIVANQGSNTITVLHNTVSTQDRTPPSITHTPVSTSVVVNNGSASPAVYIKASATDAGSGVQSIYAEYQQAGVTTSKTLNFANVASIDSVLIPSTDFMSGGLANGVSYRVVAMDSSGNYISTSWYPISVRDIASKFIASPTQLPPANSYPSSTMFQAYRIVSVPYNLDDQRPISILPTILGNHAENNVSYVNWRFQRIRSGAKQEYELFKNEAAITPGAGFFMIAKNQVALGTSGNKISNMVDLTNVGVQLTGGINGWYLLGNPLNVDIARSKLVFVGANVLGYAKYTGIGPVSGWDTTTAQTVLKPWYGIAVKTTGDCTVRFNVLSAPLNGSMKTGSPGIQEPAGSVAESEDKTTENQNDWSLSINAYRTDNEMRCEGNAIGMRAGASDGHDQYDAYQPPLIGDCNVAIGFDGEYGPMSRDIRTVKTNGDVWHMQLTTGDEHAAVKLQFGNAAHLPDPSFEAYAIDLDQQTAYNLKATSLININSGSGTRNFQIVVGTKEYLASNNAGVMLVPQEVKLYANYPNPFNPMTTIRYSVSDAMSGAAVTLKIYNVLGQEVHTLVNGFRQAGYYDVNFNGNQLASGVYFYRLIVQKSGKVISDVKKMMLLK